MNEWAGVWAGAPSPVIPSEHECVQRRGPAGGVLHAMRERGGWTLYSVTRKYIQTKHIQGPVVVALCTVPLWSPKSTHSQAVTHRVGGPVARVSACGGVLFSRPPAPLGLARRSHAAPASGQLNRSAGRWRHTPCGAGQNLTERAAGIHAHGP